MPGDRRFRRFGSVHRGITRGQEILSDRDVRKLLGTVILDADEKRINPNGMESRLGRLVPFQSIDEEKELSPAVGKVFPGCDMMVLITPTITMMREGIVRLAARVSGDPRDLKKARKCKPGATLPYRLYRNQVAKEMVQMLRQLNQGVALCVITLGLSVVPTGSQAYALQLSQAERTGLLQVREAVWRTWFNNDRAALEKLIPNDLVGINNGEEKWWVTRETVIERAAQFAAEGGRLLRLEFPRTEIRSYGDVVVLYRSVMSGSEQAIIGQSGFMRPVVVDN